MARPSPHRRLSIGDYKHRAINLQSISACTERVWPRETSIVYGNAIKSFRWQVIPSYRGIMVEVAVQQFVYAVAACSTSGESCVGPFVASIVGWGLNSWCFTSSLDLTRLAQLD